MGRIRDYVRRNGIGALKGRIAEELYTKMSPEAKYRHYIKKYEKHQNTEALKYKPLISVVLCNGASEKNIGVQTYDNYEVVTDFKASTGEFVLFLKDGFLSENALYEVAKKLNEKNYDFVYSDEDVMNGKRRSPFFKPGYSPDTLAAFWYTGCLAVYRKSLVPPDCFDYDLAKAITEKTDRVGHIPKVLYHRTRDFEIIKNTDVRNQSFEGLVSVVIPSKDNPDLLFDCLKSFKETTSGINCEVIVVDNGSSDENKQKYENIVKSFGGRYLYEKQEFNFSKMCNKGASAANGDYLLFLNDDITFDVPWLEYMLQKASEEKAGAVGVKLLYPDKKTIQHCGVALFPVGPVHLLQGCDDGVCHCFGRNRLTYNCIAVTAAALMVQKQKFDAVGGFDEELSIAYNDVELCLKLHEAGLYNINVAETHLIHHESASRGNDLADPKKRERLDRERNLLYNKHPRAKNANYDVYYNDNFSIRTVDFDIKY